MTGALIILAGMIVIGVVLYLLDGRDTRRDKEVADDAEGNVGLSEAGAEGGVPDGEKREVVSGEGEVCCGLHLVCEKTSLSPMSGEVVYYDDEELDRFRGRPADGYSPEETEEFRDVLLTLLPQDVAGWSRSIQVRGITLPSEIRDELLMIVT